MGCNPKDPLEGMAASQLMMVVRRMVQDGEPVPSTPVNDRPAAREQTVVTVDLPLIEVPAPA